MTGECGQVVLTVVKSPPQRVGLGRVGSGTVLAVTRGEKVASHLMNHCSLTLELCVVKSWNS